MLRRVPHHKDLVGQWLDENAESYFNALDMQIRNMLESYPDKKQIMDKRLAELETIRREKRIKPEHVWFNLLTSDTLPNVSWALENMTWQFLTTKEDSFITSDNPVFFFREIGVGRINSEVTFPVSRRIALWLTWQDKSCEGFRLAKDQFINEINRRTASAATKYVFFSSGKHWIINLVNKTQIHLHHLRQYRKTTAANTRNNAVGNDKE